MTVLRHIGMVLRLYEADGDGMEERVIELMRDFDMLPLVEARMETLSRGQTYKAALCAMIAADPELWMFDEPFASGMDPRGLTAFRRHARDAANRGRTVMYTTQILDVADHPNATVCWNSNAQDLQGKGLRHNFDLVKDRLGDTVHVREMDVGPYPYAELIKLFVDMNYEGWILLECRTSPSDRVAALKKQRRVFGELLTKARA